MLSVIFAILSSHPFGKEVHRGLHETQWVSEDKLRAIHSFNWAETSGRRISLDYTATKHSPFEIVHLEDVSSLLNVSIDGDELMTMAFSDVESRERFVGKYLSMQPVLVGDHGWNISAVRVVDIQSKFRTSVSFSYTTVTMTDLFRSADISFTQTLLPQDMPTRKGKGQVKNHLHDPSDLSAEHLRRRRLNFFSSTWSWFENVARGIITFVASTVQTAVKLIELIKDCADGTCERRREYSLELIDFNYDDERHQAKCTFE